MYSLLSDFRDVRLRNRDRGDGRHRSAVSPPTTPWFSPDSGNTREDNFDLVGSSFVWDDPSVSGSTAASGHYRVGSPFRRPRDPALRRDRWIVLAQH